MRSPFPSLAEFIVHLKNAGAFFHQSRGESGRVPGANVLGAWKDRCSKSARLRSVGFFNWNSQSFSNAGCAGPERSRWPLRPPAYLAAGPFATLVHSSQRLTEIAWIFLAKNTSVRTETKMR